MSLATRSVTPRVSVVVLAYRQTERLGRVLVQLRQHRSDAPYEVIVVENGAPAEVRNVIDRHPWVRRLVSTVNRGFGGGVNYAARHRKGDLLLLLNDDAEVTDGWMDGLTVCLDANPGAAAVASVLVDGSGMVLEGGGAINPEGELWNPDRGRPLAEIQGRGPRRVGYATGGSLLISGSAFDEIDGFDLAFHPAYYEDADLSCRLWRAGHQVLSTTASVVVHEESASTSSGAKWALQVRNRGIFQTRFLTDYRRCVPTVEVGQELPGSGQQRVLFIDDRVPAPGVGSGAARTRQHLLAIAATGRGIAFHPREPADGLDRELVAAGVELLPRLDAVDSGSVEAIVMSRPHNFGLWEGLAERHPGVPLVYDAEARFSARLERLMELRSGRELADVQREHASMIALEESVSRAAAAVVTISVDEAPWFAQAAPETPVVWIDPLPDRIELASPVARSADRIAFVAGWEAGADSPNGDALRWLVDEVLPAVRQQGVRFVLEVTGGQPPDEITGLAGPDIRFVGRVDDLDDFHRTARLAVAPTRYGAGVKLKVLDALVTATPVVATPVGAEGLSAQWKSLVDIHADADSYAEAIVRLLKGDDAWQQRHDEIAMAVSRHRADAAGQWSALLSSVVDPTRRDGGDAHAGQS